MLSIGKLAQASGVKVPTIRYYEQIGLLPEPERSAGNQRLYSDALLNRLRFIRHARDLGFPIEAVKELISLQDRHDLDCARVDEIASRQLAQIRGRLAQLAALEGELSRMLEHSHHGSVAKCRVIEVLSDHGLCATPHSTKA